MQNMKKGIKKVNLVIPKIKKKINAFLVGEEGKISKQSILKAGVVMGGIVIGSGMLTKGVAADHANSFSVSYNSATGDGTAMHGSHASHGSHGSHCSWMC